MQTLGPDGAPPPQPWYKLWAWPDVSEPTDAVSAARNGAIAAVAIGVMSLLIGMSTTGPAPIFHVMFYLLAAIGIRQLSFPASGMALTAYLSSQIAGVIRGQIPGVIELALSVLLIGAVRASSKAAQMNFAERAASANNLAAGTWTQGALARTGPPTWQRLRIVFNICMSGYFALLMSEMAMSLLRVVLPTSSRYPLP